MITTSSTYILVLIIGNLLTTVPNFQTLDNCTEEGQKFVTIATRAYKERPIFVCLKQDFEIETNDRAP